MLSTPDLTAILPMLPTAPMATRLHRVVNLEHYESSDPSQLLFDQSPVRSREGQRFTPAAPDGFTGIYASEDLK